MKKTLIALMALAGVAAAGDYAQDVINALNEQLTSSGYTVEGDYTYTLSMYMTGGIPYTGGNGYYTLQLDDSYYLISQNHSHWGLSDQQRDLTTDTDSFTFAKDGNTYTYTSAEGEYIYTWTRNEGNTNSGERPIGSPAGVSITLSYDGSDTILSVKANGSDITDNFVLKGTEIDLSKLVINTTANSGKGPDVGSYSVGIQSIPEPTTATLSLLALAGLAARRRRK